MSGIAMKVLYIKPNLPLSESPIPTTEKTWSREIYYFQSNVLQVSVSTLMFFRTSQHTRIFCLPSYYVF